MEISSKEEALKHFNNTKQKQLESVGLGLKAEASFSSQHPTCDDHDYFAIVLKPRLFYVLANGKITSELPT